tara:strand:+ start:707 stop:1210 length:504 start_codon:yes stop_codon:yes gene_type:complete
MSVTLESKHFKDILNYSRKISKGVNADDLSQHVIYKLLNEPALITKDVISKPKAFSVWLYRFITIEFSMCYSSFNRHLHNSYNKGREIIDLEVSDCLFEDVGTQFDNSIDVINLVKTSGLTDIERMYLNAYIDSDYNYRRCSDNLDIHPSTIKRHVKRAFDKCKSIR